MARREVRRHEYSIKLMLKKTNRGDANPFIFVLPAVTRSEELRTRRIFRSV